MQNITGKKVIQFKRLNASRRKTFIANLVKPIQNKESGGDYWISSISSLTKACKFNDNNFIVEKINELNASLKASSLKRSKDMYQRNIDILKLFTKYDFSKLKPSKRTAVDILTPKKSILNIKGISIQVYPSHVYTFKSATSDEVGAIWFIAQLGGFTTEELAILVDLLYRYLKINYSKKYTVNPNLCVVIDAVSSKEYRYSKLISSLGSSDLDTIALEMKSLLR